MLQESGKVQDRGCLGCMQKQGFPCGGAGELQGFFPFAGVPEDPLGGKAFPCHALRQGARCASASLLLCWSSAWGSGSHLQTA